MHTVYYDHSVLYSIEIKIITRINLMLITLLIGLEGFILFDVLNSHNHSVLYSIDITRRNLMLITLQA